jgi:predicted transcriptional regulator
MIKLFKSIFSKKEVIELPKAKTVNISSKYLKNKLPELQELNLKNRREKLGLSISEVNKICGTTDVSRIERSKVNTRYDIILKLHNFYLEEESKIK